MDCKFIHERFREGRIEIIFRNWFLENNIIIFDNVIILQFWYLYFCVKLIMCYQGMHNVYRILKNRVQHPTTVHNFEIDRIPLP